ncbi:unnamed protein product [Parnassius mnemosyne]|uniref:THAP-type domain-containing protein n=1 Tax=Parnassius mnemosyne TaxID=213953 RepID=A0AAV1KR03_9NEOP
MPQCSFKNCKNHTSRTLKKDGISYFRFPRNPVRCAEWISVIARQRSEEFFMPTQRSVVCSKHFLDSDEYVTTKGMKRLHKTAVPRIEANDHDVEHKSSFDKKAIEQCCLQPQDTTSIKVEPSERLQDTTSIKVEPSESPSNSLENVNIDDLDYVFESPIVSALKKKIQRDAEIKKRMAQKINNLQKQNRRLKKRVEALKAILKNSPRRKIIIQIPGPDASST